MNLNCKYKAFTLTETVFGLIISSLIIGVIYTVFTSFNKQFIMFQKQQLVTNDFMLFDATFRKDMHNAVAVNFNDETVELKRYDETIVQYSFKGNTIKRTYNEQTEVLFSKLISHTFQQQENRTSIILNLQFYNEAILLEYRKRNTPDQIINTAFIENTNVH